MSRPNVLLIVWDTCRRDALEPFGAPTGATPAAAQMAARGVIAPAAHAASSWTLPSHVALFAGLLPRAVGLTQAPDATMASCRETLRGLHERLLPPVLAAAGYDTRGTSANLWVSPESGFDTAFAVFDKAVPTRPETMLSPTLRGRLSWSRHSARGRADDGAAHQLETVRRWLRETRAEPFFWFVNLNECHSPYLPPVPHTPLGPAGRLRAGLEAREYLTLDSLWRSCAGGRLPPPEALERMRRLYAGAVRQVDAWLGDVLEALDRARVLDDTLVLLTSDHGENFGEGGLMGHGFSLDERLTHVPFVAAGPGAERLADLRALADLPRRLAELAGIERHPFGTHDVPVAQFDPPGGRNDPRLAALGDNWPEVDPAVLLQRLAQPLTAAQLGRYKLVRRGDDDTVHDLEADPLEDRGAAAPAEIVARLTRLVDEAARGAATGAPTPPGTPDTADLEARMRMLGYL